MNSLNPQEVRSFFKSARRVLHNPGFDILIAPRQGPLARLLVITSRKVGNSPERNKIRRRIKAIFHEAALFEAPFDCVVIIRRPGIEMSYDAIKELFLATVAHLKNPQL